ncbi:MAG: isoprenylcysteine carboxylmethyltransferase family protein [Pseudomonadota bacterium]
MDHPALQPLRRLLSLVLGLLRMPPGRRRIAVAFAYGLACHAAFALAVIAMIVAMFFGMSESLGRVPAPWSYAANLFLVLQFPLSHSLLLSERGRKALGWLAPRDYAGTLSTTTFALVASLQLFALFAFWTPSGIVWWRAEGAALYLMCTLYAVSWLLLIWASYDAGAEVQSGALGWMSLAQGIKPIFPDMPTTGLFRIIRQPIYVSFALTMWTVPVWTPDQLALASLLTVYCLLAPRLKEARFEKRFGAAFDEYRARVPYAVPRLSGRDGPDIRKSSRAR